MQHILNSSCATKSVARVTCVSDANPDNTKRDLPIQHAVAGSNVQNYQPVISND